MAAGMHTIILIIEMHVGKAIGIIETVKQPGGTPPGLGPIITTIGTAKCPTQTIRTEVPIIIITPMPQLTPIIIPEARSRLAGALHGAAIR